MSNSLLEKLEYNIDYAVETIESLRSQTKALETQNAELFEEFTALQEKHTEWENIITQMLNKLNTIESDMDTNMTTNTNMSEEGLSEEMLSEETV